MLAFATVLWAASGAALAGERASFTVSVRVQPSCTIVFANAAAARVTCANQGLGSSSSGVPHGASLGLQPLVEVQPGPTGSVLHVTY